MAKKFIDPETNLLAPKIEIQPEVVEPKPKKRPRTKRK